MTYPARFRPAAGWQHRQLGTGRDEHQGTLMSGQITNWAGNITFAARRVHRPQSVEQLQELVAAAPRLRVLGTGHSFNRIADTPADLVSVAALPATLRFDEANSTATFSAGLRYGELAPRLHAAGYALGNLGSLPHISVAGACATGTHGSGPTNGILATAVRGLQLVTAAGELITVSRDTEPDDFAGLVVSLGGSGVVTGLTVDLLPAYDMYQYVYDDLPYQRFADHAQEIFASGYSVSLFTDWAGPRFTQVWVKRRTDQPDDWTPRSRWLDASLADGPRHPIAGMPAANCTEQGGVPGPWHTRLPHFRAAFTPSSGDELQSEYIVARDAGLDAVAAVNAIAHLIAPVLQVCEIRTIAADDLWLSPAYRRDSLAIHFTWLKDPAAVAPVLAAVEERLAPFAARPHWGKVFTMEPAVLASRYPRLDDFRALLRRYDPAGKFRNEFMDRYVLGQR